MGRGFFKFFQIWRKNLSFWKYLDTCGQGLSIFIENETKTKIASNVFIVNNNIKLLWGDFFGLMGKFFKIGIFNILTGQKWHMAELKLVWPVNMTRHRSKIILSPESLQNMEGPNEFGFLLMSNAWPSSQGLQFTSEKKKQSKQLPILIFNSWGHFKEYSHSWIEKFINISFNFSILMLVIRVNILHPILVLWCCSIWSKK